MKQLVRVVLTVQLILPGVLRAQATNALTPAQRKAALANPKSPAWATHAPDTIVADMETSKGRVSIELIRAWAPIGVDRFYNLARTGYFDDTRFFRVLFGYIAQFGVAADPAISRAWSQQPLKPDPPREKNTRGTLTFAQRTSRDRATNLFFNLKDNPELDTLRFVPIGRVVEGMDVVDSLYFIYGEFPSSDEPLGNPKRFFRETNRYLDEKFPKLDRLLKITIRAK